MSSSAPAVRLEAVSRGKGKSCCQSICMNTAQQMTRNSQACLWYMLHGSSDQGRQESRNVQARSQPIKLARAPLAQLTSVSKLPENIMCHTNSIWIHADQQTYLDSARVEAHTSITSSSRTKWLRTCALSEAKSCRNLMIESDASKHQLESRITSEALVVTDSNMCNSACARAGLW